MSPVEFANEETLTATQRRTRQLLIQTAQEIMSQGSTPTVAELAQVAGVSRATAYRYFPSQEAIIGALAEVTHIPIRYWTPQSADVRERLHELLEFTFNQLQDGEVHHRAILQMHLANWARDYPQAPPPTRGHRRELIQRALEPMRKELNEKAFERLAQALSPLFGIELFTVFRDMWGLSDADLKDRAHWMIDALVSQAFSERTIIGNYGASI